MINIIVLTLVFLGKNNTTVLFLSAKCTNTRLAAGLHLDLLGSLQHSQATLLY